MAYQISTLTNERTDFLQDAADRRLSKVSCLLDNFATGCGKNTGAGLAVRYSLWGHPEKYLVELVAVFAFVGLTSGYAGKLNYSCSADADALTQIFHNH